MYLGRLHPIKNIELLIRAWKTIGDRHPAWVLAIAGDGPPVYREHLESMARAINNTSVIFLGRLQGEQKAIWLSRAKLFVLSSLSEGMPMAPLEAMAYRTPVVLTKQCNLREVEQYNAGRVCDATLESLEHVLSDVLTLEPSILSVMGDNARSLVEAKYSWQRVSGQLLQVYRWMHRIGDKPAFVFD